jgi:hypothetical protein
MLYARRRWTLLVVGVLVAVLLLAGSPASANSPRITRGDVQAIFQATLNGGVAIELHSPTGQGAPFAAQERGAIRPLAVADGRHFCAEDWHVILVAGIDGGDASFRREQAVASASQTRFDFTLDGAPLATERTAIRRVVKPETIQVPEGEEKLKEAYSFQQGRIMSPDDLSVGRHELTLTQTDTASGEAEQLGITFFIDAAGTGACLND